ncbi:hypothetical protein RYX36_022171, partial [Vicia faba]
MLNINLFKFCSFLRVFGYLMILLFAAIVSLTYYAVVFVTWGPLLFPSFSFLAFFILLIFHTLLVLLTWSYSMAVLKDPGSVPQNWRPHQQFLQVEVDDHRNLHVAVPQTSGEFEEEVAVATATSSV